MSTLPPNIIENPALRTAARFCLAAIISIVIHAALIYGIQLKTNTPRVTTPSIIEARIQVPLSAQQEIEIAIPPKVIVESEPSAASDSEASPKMEAEPEKSTEAEPATATPPSPNVGMEQPNSNAPTVDIPLLEDPTYYAARQLDVRPAPLFPIEVKYPEAAAIANVSGEIVLLIMLDESGIVKDISVVRATPPGFFEDAAIDAFRKGLFSPAQIKGRAVKSRYVVRIGFGAQADH